MNRVEESKSSSRLLASVYAADVPSNLYVSSKLHKIAWRDKVLSIVHRVHVLAV